MAGICFLLFFRYGVGFDIETGRPMSCQRFQFSGFYTMYQVFSVFGKIMDV